ncbi:MAG: efflux transporter outer membrane subunit [Candidatus Abyssobacteria bacterium SURF_5]|uniref:Efflux transporter outer membrane subunit n=1 Tax=Abyssobacteria bacterium (strain SURF_5) TaxID=2093360 RepID=A0A3A4NZ83_ABYX5|nr:MAG: efflux transporter outer membrane subunit [Candidatus Abyssubacteria bacterium SURF_5]
MTKKISAILMVLLITGCAAVGPNYVSPTVSAPDQWSSEPRGGLSGENPDISELAGWWSILNDPILTNLIERASRDNLGLLEAVSRIREARAVVGINRAGLFPSITGGGDRSYSRSSGQTGSGERADFYSTGFDAAWELDIFGGVRRSVEAAVAELEASEADLHDVLVILVSEVALNYINVRTLQARISVSESNLEKQQDTYELVLARFEAGLTSRLDLEEATSNLESTHAQIPPLRVEIEQAKNRIAVLLGDRPGALDDVLSQPEPIPVIPLEVAVGVPADALRRRPDIRRAERRVAAQTARIGVATADLYPRFQLPGSIGLESLSLDTLFRGGSYTYRYGPNFSVPVFTAGSIRQNIVVQDALAEQALLQYETTILTALEEVENALVAYADEQVRRQALLNASEAAARAAELAEMQYAAGLIDFQIVLDAQRSLLAFEEQLARSEGEVVSNLIRLYRALGGGWMPLVSTEG